MADLTATKIGRDVAPYGRGVSGRLGAGLRRGIVALALLLPACTAVQLPAGGAPLDPVAFFTGETQGTGTLRTVLGQRSTVVVRSRGTPQAGGLTLVQEIKEGSKALRIRTWTIRTGSDGFYSGSLTDAEGLVVMHVEGSRALVAYRTPSGLSIRQQLALQKDGRTVLNHLEAYKFGIRVARLDEVIRKR